MKLEDISKKNIYTVPDKYFDQLPAKIQARVQTKKPIEFPVFNWSLTYKIAAPVFALVLLAFFWFNNQAGSETVESLLAQVSTEDLVAYLETTDITTEEIIESIDFENLDLDLSDETPIMQGVDMDEESLKILLDEFAVDEELL
jgi:hypothetical protein